MISSTEVEGGLTPTALGLPASLEDSGLNVAGVLSSERYDALVPPAWKCAMQLPAARSVYVVGSGGSDFYRAARSGSPNAAHPLDEFLERHLSVATHKLAEKGHASRALFYWQRLLERENSTAQFADFVSLAEAAGLGARSRLGLLLHPVFGPWFAIRAVILSEQPFRLESPTPELESPCSTCSAPCVAACPGKAVTESEFSLERCSQTRHETPQCAERCDARLACPVGATHRYSPEALSHHMTAHFRADS